MKASPNYPADQESLQCYRELCCLGPGRPEPVPGTARAQRNELRVQVAAAAEGLSAPPASGWDALGKTNWFQGLWPTDFSMPEPKFPHWEVSPVDANETGVVIRRTTYNDPLRQSLAPLLRFEIERGGVTEPLYSGDETGSIDFRTGNLLSLRDTAGGLQRSFEMIVHSHFLLLFRIRFGGEGEVGLRLGLEFDAADHGTTENGRVWRLHNGRGWHGVTLQPSSRDGEVLGLAVYDSPTEWERDAVIKDGLTKLTRFDGIWDRLASSQAIEPFLAGGESQSEKNLIGAFVNRALRNTRAGGQIHQPSLVEFYGPEWDFGDAVWINFLPACRYMLWIAPETIANSIRTLLDFQTPEGMVPQAVFSRTTFDYSQIPNISPCVRDYYVFTGDRHFLGQAYGSFKNWYRWWMTHRNPTGNGIIATGNAGQDLYSAICEYKDNGTDPNDPEVFENTCNPLTRTPEIAGRPERAYLPDIVACQAHMAEDLAFFARELGHVEDAAYFEGEYRRIREWANENLWDEATGFYYPVVRANGKKVMKRTNTVYWLMWAGLVPPERTKKLIEALFDPKQFLAKIPVPMVALDDPSFNPLCGHWGDAYSWPVDAFKAFEALIRYGEWDRAAEFCRHYNKGVFEAIGDTLQPAEFYHSAGYPCGCPIMGTAGLTPLNFQRYLRDHARGHAEREWSRFIP
jgi:hypothetical protein